FFFSSRRRHTRSDRDWSSDVCSSDLGWQREVVRGALPGDGRERLLAGHLGVTGQQAGDLLREHLGGLTDAGVGHLGQVELALPRSEERRVGKEGRCGWGGVVSEKKRQ